jgi:hypothetical protein
METFSVGVVGYCPPTQFDEQEARRMIIEAYEKISLLRPKANIRIVSGATNVGVLKIAYEEATKRKWKTVGVACKRAKEHPLFPVDELIIVGEEWGEESETFVGMLDAIIRIGIGKQSLREAEEVKNKGKMSIEYDLPPLPA